MDKQKRQVGIRVDPNAPVWFQKFQAEVDLWFKKINKTMNDGYKMLREDLIIQRELGDAPKYNRYCIYLTSQITWPKKPSVDLSLEPLTVRDLNNLDVVQLNQILEYYGYKDLNKFASKSAKLREIKQFIGLPFHVSNDYLIFFYL